MPAQTRTTRLVSAVPIDDDEGRIAAAAFIRRMIDDRGNPQIVGGGVADAIGSDSGRGRKASVELFFGFGQRTVNVEGFLYAAAIVTLVLGDQDGQGGDRNKQKN